MFCFLDQNIMTTQLHLVALKWERDRVTCSAAQADRLERACRLQLAHCALFNKASRFMTPPLGILILILFLALSHFPSLCLFCHKMLRTLFSFVFEFPLCLSPVCLFNHVLLNAGERVRVRLMHGVDEGGGTSWTNQISKYPISHIDKLISVQIKWRNPPLIIPKEIEDGFEEWNKTTPSTREKKSNYQHSKILEG